MTLEELAASGYRFQGLSLEEPKKLERNAAKDLGVSLAKGVAGIPEALVGIADIPTLGRAGKGLQDLGIDFKKAQGALDEYYSPAQKADNAAVEASDGFINTAGTMLSRPSTILHGIVQSAPSMVAGGFVGRGVAALAPRVVGQAAGAGIGEGTMMAGSQAEKIRQETTDGYLTPAQAGAAGLTGVLGGVIGYGSGKLATKAGIGNADSLAFGVKKTDAEALQAATGAQGKGFAKRVGQGMATEGAEEMAQSYFEQGLYNAATGKDWNDKMGSTLAQAGITGAAMGGASAPFHGGRTKSPEELAKDAAAAIRAEKQPEAGTLSAGLNAGIEAQAQKVDALAPRGVAGALGYTPAPFVANAPQLGNEQTPIVVDGQGNAVYDTGATTGRIIAGSQGAAPETRAQAQLLAQREQQASELGLRGLRMNAGNVTDVAFTEKPAAPVPANYGAKTSAAASFTPSSPTPAASPTPHANANGSFATAEAAQDYISLSRRNGSQAIAAAVAPNTDGSFTPVLKGDPRYNDAVEFGRVEKLKAKNAAMGVQPDDVLNPAGTPFTALVPARNKAKNLPDHEVVQLESGSDAKLFVVRPKAQPVAPTVKAVENGTPLQGQDPGVQQAIVGAPSAVAAPSAPVELSRAATVEAKTGRVLQNRNRQSPQSIAQMTAIAAKPDFMRAGISNTMQDGAPVVFADADQLPSSAVTGDNDTAVDGVGNRYDVQYAVVEGSQVLASNKADGTPVAEYDNGTPNTVRPVAGNGRAAGIKQGYTQGNAAQYRSDLETRAQRIGIDPSAIKGMTYPVLVRVMPEAQVTDDIGDLSNISQTAALSPVEQAKTDAARIDLDRIEFDDNGVTTDSVAAWVGSLPQTEASGLTSDGEVSKQAISRLANAVFYKAYGSDNLVKLYGEAKDPEVARVMHAAGKAAPIMAQLEGAGDYDIRGAVVEAVKLAVNARRQGNTLSDHLKTRSIDESGEGVAVALFMAKNMGSGKVMSEGLTNLATRALEAVELQRSNAEQNGFFETVSPPTRAQLFEGLGNAEQAATLTERNQRPASKLDDRSTGAKTTDPRVEASTGANEQERAAETKPAITVEFKKQGDYWNYSGDKAPEIAKALNLVVSKRNGVPIVTVPDYAYKQYQADLKKYGFDAAFNNPSKPASIEKPTFEQLRSEAEKLNAETDAAGAALNLFPKELGGLIADDVRATKEWQQAKSAFDNAFTRSKTASRLVARAYPKESRDYEMKKRLDKMQSYQAKQAAELTLEQKPASNDRLPIKDYLKLNFQTAISGKEATFNDTQKRISELEQKIESGLDNNGGVVYKIKPKQMAELQLELLKYKQDLQILANAAPSTLTLEQQTADEARQEIIDAEAAAKKQAADNAKYDAAQQAAKLAKENKQAADKSVDDFELGQDVSGQTDIFAEENPQPKNTISEKELKAKAKALDALSRLAALASQNARANFTPEEEKKLLPILIDLLDAAIDLGAVTFDKAVAYVKNYIAENISKDVADRIPFETLQGAYISVARNHKDEGVTTAKEVVSYENENELKAKNAPSPDQRVERDSQGNTPTATVERTVQRDSANAASDDRQTPLPSGRSSPSRQSDSVGVQTDSAFDGNESSDNLLRGDTRQAGLTRSDARTDDSERSGDAGDSGILFETIPAEKVSAIASSPRLEIAARAAQTSATKGVKLADIDSIRATLPALLPNQQDDVLISEKRFAKPAGYGMLFTNGTGTGKTFVGLGILKRFELQGKNNALIVVPDDKIASDWVASGTRLDLKINQLQDTRTAGSGIVVTTYANLGQNDALAGRTWDLIIADEAHTLMQAEKAETTTYLQNLRAITMHPSGAMQRFTMQNRTALDEQRTLGAKISEMRRNGDQGYKLLDAQYNRLSRTLGDKQVATENDVRNAAPQSRTRLAFLSATPFAYEKTIDWANGYLFDYNEGYTGNSAKDGGLSYNEPDAYQSYMIANFGYRMRTNKLTEPDAKVNRGLMQRQFNSKLKKEGVLSGRVLDVEYDYDRRFVLVNSAIGNEIDRAIEWLRERTNETGAATKSANGYSILGDLIREKFDYLTRRYFLEAIKAKEAVAIVKSHMALGRKVVVFHDYNKGGASNPFDLDASRLAFDGNSAAEKRAAAGSAIAAFRAEFPKLLNIQDLDSPIEVFAKELPQTLFVNGKQKKSTLLENYKKFQDDNTPPTVMLVQSAKNKGWSGHDTTGKNQRVLINLGQPTAPTLAIQQEGRIYRTGQASNAIMRYLNTGTNWEKWAFATTIASRASTAENLGMGEASRALKDSFIDAFNDSDTYPAGHDEEGTGGKEKDKAANNMLSEYDRAKSAYYGQLKKTSKTKAQEGTDYFATPEPLGLKMTEWLDLKAGESVLEPSAGHGAIARWLRDDARRTVIEPSLALRSRLAMVMNPAEDKILNDNFEDLNVVNKFDGIVMNPPFGTGGKTAIEHLAKAATHLRDGGRIVALIPEGASTDKRFNQWFYDETDKPIKPLYEHPELGAIYKGDKLAYTLNGKNIEHEIVLVTPPTPFKNIATIYDTNRSKFNLPPDAKIKSTGARTVKVRQAEGFNLIAEIKLPSVTFNRAGTAVNTRIVIIQKGKNTPQQKNIDLTDAASVEALFDELENVELKPRPEGEEPAVMTRSTVLPKSQENTSSSKTTMLGGKEYPVETYTTAAGKKLVGAWVGSKDEALSYGVTTFKKDGKFFVRERDFEKTLSSQATTTKNPSTITAVRGAIEGLFTGVNDAWAKISKNTVVVEDRADIPADVISIDALKSLPQDAQDDLLSQYTREEALAKQTREEQAAKDAGRPMPAVRGKSFKADQVDLFNPQDALFSKDDARAQAFYQPSTGKIYLIANRIEQGTELSVWLHEVFHKQGEALLGKKMMQALHDTVQSWKRAKTGSVERQVYEAAHARAESAADFALTSIDELNNSERNDIITAFQSNKIFNGFGEAWVNLFGASPSDSDINGQLFDLVEPLLIARKVISIDRIKTNKAVSNSVVLKYAELKTKYPAILVAKNNNNSDYYVVEGGHRFDAATIRGDKNIEVIDVSSIAGINWEDFLNGEPIQQTQKDPAIYNAEFLAYAIEEANNRGITPDMAAPANTVQGWLARVFDAFGRALNKLAKGITAGKVPDFNVRDLMAMAYGAAGLELDGKSKGNRGGETIATSLTPFDGKEQAKTPLGDTKTVTVDGIEYSVLNNLGKPIHPTIEGVRNFVRWFGDSLVTDNGKTMREGGKPMVVYHGTSADFSEFRQGGGDFGVGMYFSNDKDTANLYAEKNQLITGNTEGGNVIPSYLKINDPFQIKDRYEMNRVFDGNNSGKPLNDFQKSRGYDGRVVNSIIMRGDVRTNEKYFIAFDPNQIKSATGNNGDFNPANDDIRLSVAAQPPKPNKLSEVALNLASGNKYGSAAVNGILDHLTTQKGFNALHTTLGTQLHKAKINPLFGRVFKAAQGYMNSVQQLTNDAVVQAPNLLPQNGSGWAAIKTLAGDAATLGAKIRARKDDVGTTAKAVFDGTLHYARDSMGKLITTQARDDKYADLSLEQKQAMLLADDHVATGTMKSMQGRDIDTFTAYVDNRFKEAYQADGVVFTDAELKSEFGLNDKQIGLYKEFRAATDKSLDDLAASTAQRMMDGEDFKITDTATAAAFIQKKADTLRDSVKEADDDYAAAQAEADRLAALSEQVHEVIERTAHLKKHGYAPLMRFGRYAVATLNADGSLKAFNLFEREAQANKFARESTDKGEAVRQSVLAEIQEVAGVSPESLAVFADILERSGTLGESERSVMDEYIRHAVSQRSALKRQLKREGYEGYSEDATRVLAAFITSNARLASKNAHFGEMVKAHGEILKPKLAEGETDTQRQYRSGDVADEAKKLIDYIQNPTEEAAKIRGLMFVHFIGGSVASAMVNLTQPLMQTFPFLTQHMAAGKLAGVFKANFANAAAAAKGETIKLKDAAMQADYDRAVRDGVVSPHDFHTVQGEAIRGFGNNEWVKNALTAWGGLFSVTESFNRNMTFLAAHEVARSLTAEQLRATGHASAYDFAVNAIDETQGVYNKANRPNWARGAVGATVFTFKQYSISYIELLARMPRKQQIMMLGALFLASGADGLPFAEDLDDLLDTLGQKAGYNTNSKLWKKRLLTDMVGIDGANLLLRGLGGNTGLVDASGRLGMGNLIPATAMFKPSEKDGGKAAFELAGAAGSYLNNIRMWLAGERDTNAIAPVAIANVMKGMDMFATGQYRNGKGAKVIDVTATEALMKTIGWQPQSVAEAQRDTFTKQASVDYRNKMESDFANKIAQAMADNKPDEAKEARADVQAWNERNPDTKIQISGQQIRKRITELRMNAADRAAKRLPREMRGNGSN